MRVDVGRNIPSPVKSVPNFVLAHFVWPCDVHFRRRAIWFGNPLTRGAIEFGEKLNVGFLAFHLSALVASVFVVEKQLGKQLRIGRRAAMLPRRISSQQNSNRLLLN
jgi:hypothetical protein